MVVNDEFVFSDEFFFKNDLFYAYSRACWAAFSRFFIRMIFF